MSQAAAASEFPVIDQEERAPLLAKDPLDRLVGILGDIAERLERRIAQEADEAVA
jgi:hypothetical protein